MQRTFLLASIFLAATFAAHICEVALDSFNDAVPTVSLAGSSYEFTGDHFNVISYGNFHSTSGDIEGRAAVKSNVDVTTYSFGYELVTRGVTANDIHLPYSLVAGGNVAFNGGALYPQGNDYPYPGDKEYMYIGGTFTGSDYLRNDPSFAEGSGNKNSAFDASQAYYTKLQKAFGDLPVNSYVIKPYSTLKLTCPNMAETTIVATVDASLISTGTDWQTQSCNPDAQIILNIVGGDLTLGGNTGIITGATNQKVLFNVLGSGRTINIQTEVQANILAPNNVYNQNGYGVVKGQVIVGDVTNVLQINLIKCVPPRATPPTDPDHFCPAFETDCAGLDVTTLSTSSFNLREFNAIVFGNYKADTGDVEGRLFVGGNFEVGNGYTIGYELITANNAPDRSLPFSLIVGQNLTWGSGSIHPDGTGFPHGGNGEFGLVGGDSSTTPSIAERLVKGDTAQIQAELADAKTCYNGYSAKADAKKDNTQSKVAYSGLFVTCNDQNATEYVLSITNTQLSQITYYSVSGCNFQANWIINIRGTGDIVFSGDNFPAIPGAIVFNVVGQRNIVIKETAFRGHLLAPDSTLTLTSASWGKIVVSEVLQAVQFNKANTCPDIVTVKIPIVAAAAAQQGATQVTVFDASTFVIGDNTQYGPISDVDYVNNVLTFAQPLSQPVSAGSLVTYAEVPSNSGRYKIKDKDVPETSTTAASSATTLGLAFSAIVVAVFVL